MVTVRPATAADAHAIATVHVRTWQAAYDGLMPAEALAALDVDARAAFWTRVLGSLTPPGALLVATTGDAAETGDAAGTGEAGGVVGFASVGRYSPVEAAGDPESVDAGQVYAIYVSPGRWSTGAGHALMRASVDHLAAHGFTDIRLWVLDTNERARRFYERFGYVTDGGEQLDDGFPGIPPLREVRYALRLG